MAKVKLTNTVSHRVFVTMPHLMFRHEWMPGASFEVEESMFEQMMFDAGFRCMINDGTLYIENMEEKKKLGLEPEDATEPKNIIVLSEKERRKYLTTLTLEEFKAKIEKLSYDQVMALADYAIKNRLIDYDKCEVLKSKCGKDIITAVRLSKQNKE